MWKVLIADDEPAIREGLRGMIEETFEDLEVVFEAEDGEIAFNYALENPPDIFFVDICMPFMDGIQLIEQLQQVMETSIVIIITGHDEFGYAKKAISLNVFDYILKPLKQEVFEKVVKQAIEWLSQTQMQETYNKWAYSQLRIHNKYLKEKFLRNWLDGKYGVDEAMEQMRFLEVKVDPESYMLMISSVDLDDGGKASKWDKQLLVFALKNIVDEMLEPWAPNVSFQDKNGFIIALFKKDIACEREVICCKLRSTIKELLDQLVLIHLDEIHSLSDVVPTYKTLKNSLKKELGLTPIVLLCKNYLDANYMDDSLNLQTMSMVLQISPSYVSKLLRRELGVSFIEYLTEIRISKAIDLLKNPYLKMYEVAEAVGYKNQHYFSAAFKKKMSISPNKYRKGIIKP